MFCANCGTKQNEGEKFCPNCGTKFEEPLKVEEVKVKEVIKPESSEPKENVSPKKKDTIIQSKKETPQKVSEANTNNISRPEVLDEEIEKLIKEAENGDMDARLRLAIKYEFGLGVSVNLIESEKYYKLIENEDVLNSSFVDLANCYNYDYGVLDNKYKVDLNDYFNKRIRNFRKIDNIKGVIHFRYYINKCGSDDSDYEKYRDLNKKITYYNLHFRNWEIKYENNGLSYLVEGYLKKIHSNVKGFKSFFVDQREIEREIEAEKLLLEICELSETISVKL